jgi:hypothetical protein
MLPAARDLLWHLAGMRKTGRNTLFVEHIAHRIAEETNMYRLWVGTIVLLLAALVRPDAIATAAAGAVNGTHTYRIFIPITSAKPEPNTIRNADFELGSNGDWRELADEGAIVGAAGQPLEPRSGDWMAALRRSPTGHSAIGQAVVLPRAGGQISLYLAYHYQIRSARACGTATGEVVVQAADGRTARQTFRICAAEATASWQFAQLEITALAGQPATITVRTSAAGDGDAFYVDDFSFGALIPPVQAGAR